MMCWRPALGTRSEIANIKNLLRARKAGAPEGLLFANLCWISCNRLVEKARKPPRSEPTPNRFWNATSMSRLWGCVGMTLNRLAKQGLARRKGHVWFPVGRSFEAGEAGRKSQYAYSRLISETEDDA